MVAFSKQDRQSAVAQTLGSWAIEGFTPDAEYLVLLNRYVCGELTIAQVSAATDAEFCVEDSRAGKN
jgi:hypothetical protein